MASPTVNSPATPPLTGRELFALVLGLFLGLALLKFGNPVILDGRIPAPTSLLEALSLTQPWPTRWGNWLILALAAVGAFDHARMGHELRLGKDIVERVIAEPVIAMHMGIEYVRDGLIGHLANLA